MSARRNSAARPALVAPMPLNAITRANALLGLRGRGSWTALACIVLVAALLSCSLAPAARASSTQESILGDDPLVLNGGPATRAATLDELRSLGVDTVRVLVIWNRLAPQAGSGSKPAGLDASDPSAYPAGSFDPYVAVLDAAAARGMHVLLTPTGPGPDWASRCSPRRGVCNPSPAEYRAFVTALGRAVPKARDWALYNEPNVSSWLAPQFSRRGGRYVPTSPGLYRRLVAGGLSGLRASGHGSNRVLIGETAPSAVTRGSGSARSMATGVFVRGLFCLTGSLRRSAASDCRSFAPIRVSGFAHHPYIRGGSAAPTTPPRGDEITIGSLSRLTRILDRAGSYGRIPRGLGVFYTEFGFQTSPPDRTLGVPLSAQARYINQSDWIAFRQSRVRSVAQYPLRDDAGLGGFQSGLRFSDGRAKPSLAAYRLPIWVVARGRSVTVFGQVRPAADGARETVEIQQRSFSGRFRTVKRVTTSNRKGFILVKLANRSGLWRLRWTPSAGGSALVSRETGVSSR